MSKETLVLGVSWSAPTWQSWWRYQAGKIIRQTPAGIVIDSIHRNAKTGQVRLYSPSALDGRPMAVNSDAPVTLRKRGRFGRLYLSV